METVNLLEDILSRIHLTATVSQQNDRPMESLGKPYDSQSYYSLDLHSYLI
jgi:hypothetical protein